MSKPIKLVALSCAAALLVCTTAAPTAQAKEVSSGITEKKIATEDLPKAIADEIKQQHPGAKIDAVLLVNETYYEVECETAFGETEIQFYPDGTAIEDTGEESRAPRGFGGFRGVDDAALDWEDLPKPVRETLARSIPDVEFESLERDEKDGRISYKARYIGELGNAQAKLTEAGDIIEIRSKMETKSLPAAIINAVEQAFKGADIEDASVFHETSYKITLKMDSNDLKVRYTADGNEEEEPR